MVLPKINIVLKPRGSYVEIDGQKVDHVRNIKVDHEVGKVPTVTVDIVSDEIIVNGVADSDIIEVAGSMRKGEPWGS